MEKAFTGVLPDFIRHCEQSSLSSSSGRSVRWKAMKLDEYLKKQRVPGIVGWIPSNMIDLLKETETELDCHVHKGIMDACLKFGSVLWYMFGHRSDVAPLS